MTYEQVYKFLRDLDRRWIFLLMALAVGVPILLQLDFPEKPGRMAQDVFDEIDKLEEGDRVLMAWDYAGMRAKQPPRLRWVTRMSVRSAGHDFGEASLAMIAQAAPLFGEQVDDLVRTRTAIGGRKADVEIGESTVIEATPNEP